MTVVWFDQTPLRYCPSHLRLWLLPSVFFGEWYLLLSNPSHHIRRCITSATDTSIVPRILDLGTGIIYNIKCFWSYPFPLVLSATNLPGECVQCVKLSVFTVVSSLRKHTCLMHKTINLIFTRLVTIRRTWKKILWKMWYRIPSLIETELSVSSTALISCVS
jgi:hypothetical protein